jgi:hypothetical protein
MGFDYRIRFDDPAWYAAHRARVLDRARALPCAVPVRDVGGSSAWKPTDSEIWLKAPGSSEAPGDWPYDVRIYVDDELAINVTTFGDAYFSCLRSFVRWIEQETASALVDDDGDPVEWPGEGPAS